MLTTGTRRSTACSFVGPLIRHRLDRFLLRCVTRSMNDNAVPTATVQHSVLVRPSIGKKPKVMERSDQERLRRHTPRDFGFTETFQIMKQGWALSLSTVAMARPGISTMRVLRPTSSQQPLLADLQDSTDNYPDSKFNVLSTGGTWFLTAWSVCIFMLKGCIYCRA